MSDVIKDRSPDYAAEAERIRAENRGHGYVYERADGVKGVLKADGKAIDCGGPASCRPCRLDWLHRYAVAWPQVPE